MARNCSTILIRSTTQKVWDALTQPECVRQWQFGSELITDWQAGSEIRFVNQWNGQKFEQWGTVLEILPPERLTYNLFFPQPGIEDKPENYFVMHYILEQQGENVKLEIVKDDHRPGAVQEDPQGDENPVLKALKDLIENEN